MLELTTQVSRGVMFIRIEGTIDKNNFYKVDAGYYNDLNENFYSIHGLTADFKLIRDLRNAESISLKLTDTILSSIALSGLSVADAAATVINVLRSLGRSLADLREIPQSNATALTIAINGPLFPKPDWFYGRFSKMLCEQLGEKEANALGSVLSNFKVFEEQNNE